MQKTLFGPSGNEEAFYKENSATVQAPEYLKNMGLDLFEYSFTKGVNVSDETAKKIGEQAKKHKIQICAHAQYYINLASDEEEAVSKAVAYLTACFDKLALMGGNRVVVHVGSSSKDDRAIVLARTKTNLIKLGKILDKKYGDNYILCLEVMGRYSAIGNLDEILELTNTNNNFSICVDFGHLNCLTQGAIAKDKKMLEEAVIKIKTKLPEEKQKKLHIHFSQISFGPKGELKHLDLHDDDEKFKFDFTPLASLLKKYELYPWVISESKTTQAHDAKILKTIYENV